MKNDQDRLGFEETLEVKFGNKTRDQPLKDMGEDGEEGVPVSSLRSSRARPPGFSRANWQLGPMLFRLWPPCPIFKIFNFVEK